MSNVIQFPTLNTNTDAERAELLRLTAELLEAFPMSSIILGLFENAKTDEDIMILMPAFKQVVDKFHEDGTI